MNIVFAEEVGLNTIPFIREVIEKSNHKGLCIIGTCKDRRYLRALTSGGVMILGNGEKLLKDFEITSSDLINFITEKPYEEIFELLKRTEIENLDFRIYRVDGSILDVKKIVKSKIEDKPVLRTRVIGNDINLDSIKIGDYYTISTTGETYWELLTPDLLPKISENCKIKLGSFNLKTTQEDTRIVDKRLCSGSKSFVKYRTKQVSGEIKGGDKIFKRTEEVFDSIFINEKSDNIELKKLVKELINWALLDKPAPILVLGKDLQKILFNIGISKKHMMVVERES